MVLQHMAGRRTHTPMSSPGETGLAVAEKPSALLSYIKDRQAMDMSISEISQEIYSRADRAGVGCVSLTEFYSSLVSEEAFSSSDHELRQLLRMIKPVTSGFICEDEFEEAFRNFARRFQDSRGRKEGSDSVRGAVYRNAKSKTGSITIDSQNRTRRIRTHDGSVESMPWAGSTAKAGNYWAGGVSCRTRSQSKADVMEGVQAANNRKSQIDSYDMGLDRHPGLTRRSMDYRPMTRGTSIEGDTQPSMSRRSMGSRPMTMGGPVAPGSSRQLGARRSMGSSLITLTPAAKTNTRRSMDMLLPEWTRTLPSTAYSLRSTEMPQTPKQKDIFTSSLGSFTGANSSSTLSLPAIHGKADHQGHSLFPETTPHSRRVQQEREEQDLEKREMVRRYMDQNSEIRGIAGGGRHWSEVKNGVQASSAMRKLLPTRRQSYDNSGSKEEREEQEEEEEEEKEKEKEEHLPVRQLPTFKSNFDSHAKIPHRGIKSVYLDRKYLTNYIPAFRGVKISRWDGTVVMDELLLHLGNHAHVLHRHLKSMTAGLKRNTVEGSGDYRTPSLRVDFKTLIGLLFHGSSDRDIQGCIDACNADNGHGMSPDETEALDSIEESKGLFDCLDLDCSGTVSRVEIINGKRKGLVYITEQDIDRICVTPCKKGAVAEACFDDFFEWHSGQVQVEPPLIPLYA